MQNTIKITPEFFKKMINSSNNAIGICEHLCKETLATLLIGKDVTLVSKPFNDFLKDKYPEAYQLFLTEFPQFAESKRWEPKYEEEYFIVNEYGEIEGEIHQKYKFTNTKHFNYFNCFHTKEEAQLEADRILVWRQYRAFAREKNGDWKPDIKSHQYHMWGIHLGISYTYDINTSVNTNRFIAGVVFKTREHAEEAIAKFGDDLKLLVEYN